METFIKTNQFGKTSNLSLTTANKDNKTILSNVSFTAPYKIMQPFPLSSGGIRVMLLAASAGIMEGDRQEFNFDIKENTILEFISQSYDKIHQMNSGCAKRHSEIHVDKNAAFYFNPQPTIPFAKSAFINSMNIYLADETSHFFMSEIFSCGRYACGEKFEYRFYHNLVNIYRNNKLIYRDNTRYEPALFEMNGLGMYEGFTHLANIFVSIPQNPDEFITSVNKILEFENNNDAEINIEGGITQLSYGDFAIRILGKRAQILEKINSKILSLINKYKY